MKISNKLFLSAFFHPATEFCLYLQQRQLFIDYYHYLKLIKYFFCFLDHITAVFVEFKFYILAIERVIALKRRKSEDMPIANVPGKLLGVTFLIVTFEIVLKTILYCCFDTADSFEIRFEKGITLSRSPRFFLFGYCALYSSLFLGVILLKYTKRYVKQLRLASESLTESFELSQTKSIVRLISSLLLLYIGCCLLCLPTGILTFYISFFEYMSIWDTVYDTMVKTNYFILSCYTLSSVIYAFHRFGVIRNRHVSVTIDEVVDEQKLHFDYLADSWASVKHKKSLP
ncbi:unnamed protein product [Bursaphelenchus okinawaensis]|uniref:G_PROTEIN_RECEP_F1_2 domain-containing protein n=1 Tax=Bursaphelenchus okinawaensis TaxID=465554 RepID=A0A811L940_9BILA|nr:unnamed protein product [Bursaphelenchus okinawaensis]CAG9121332.1 unnamed protein product [Bursaphelenchus okinawaensis]